MALIDGNCKRSVERVQLSESRVDDEVTHDLSLEVGERRRR